MNRILIAASGMLMCTTAARAQTEQDICASARYIASHYPNNLKVITGKKDGDDYEGKIAMPLSRYCYVAKKRSQYACFYRSKGDQAAVQSLALMNTVAACFPSAAASDSETFRSIRLDTALLRMSRSQSGADWTVLVTFLPL